MSYQSIELPTPEIFEGAIPNSKILIIGSGHSTSKILPYKDKFNCHFNTVISCNSSFREFDDVIGFHLVTEKTSKSSNNNVYKALSENDYRTDVPRIVNWKGLEMYPKKYNLVKVVRSYFGPEEDIRKYKHTQNEGILVGPVGSQKFALGSVMLSAMHLAAMIGASEIYMIGADMCFRDEFDHYYKDRVYRDPPKEFKAANQHKIVKVSVDGKKYETTEYYKESAELIDELIPTMFGGIDVFDFSGGLISKAVRLDVKDFFNDK